MSLQAFTDGVADLFANDATFASDISAILGSVPTVLRGNRPLAGNGAIDPGQLPVIVIEQGGGQPAGLAQDDDEFLTIGSYAQGCASDLDCAFVWMEHDRETASRQRTQLPEPVIQLFLRNPQPGGVNHAWISDWEPVTANHPIQVWRFVITGQYEVS